MQVCGGATAARAVSSGRAHAGLNATSSLDATSASIRFAAYIAALPAFTTSRATASLTSSRRSIAHLLAASPKPRSLDDHRQRRLARRVAVCLRAWRVSPHWVSLWQIKLELQPRVLRLLIKSVTFRRAEGHST